MGRDLTCKELVELVTGYFDGSLRGRRRLIVRVPALSPGLSSWWLHLVTPVEARVARPLVEGLRNPTIAEDDGIRRLRPFPLTPFDDAARAALAR